MSNSDGHIPCPECGVDAVADDREFWYRCKECDVIYESGARMHRHVCEHLPSFPFSLFAKPQASTSLYEMMEVSVHDVIKSYVDSSQEGDRDV